MPSVNESPMRDIAGPGMLLGDHSSIVHTRGGRSSARSIERTAPAHRRPSRSARCRPPRLQCCRVSNATPSGHQPGTSAAEHLSPSFPERAAVGHRQQAARLAGRGARAATSRPSRATSSPRRRPAPARPPSPCASPPNCAPAASIDRITVVAPTEHLKRQWADAAAPRRHPSRPRRSRNAHGRYGPALPRRRRDLRAGRRARRRCTASSPQSGRTLVILDEVHHGGDALCWGDAIREAFEPATRRLSLTGTPFRMRHRADPVRALRARRSRASALSQTDYNYGYGRALADGVVRPVMFMVYAGHMRWRTKAGDEMEARLGEGNTKDITSQAWRTALEPDGRVDPGGAAGGRPAAHRGAARHPGCRRPRDRDRPDRWRAPTPSILEDDHRRSRSPSCSPTRRRPATASRSSPTSTSRWMVAVRMVSEGVDVPRLAVGVYATSASTPLFFAQAIGRFVRARRRGETASVFLPNVPSPAWRWPSELELAARPRARPARRTTATTAASTTTPARSRRTATRAPPRSSTRVRPGRRSGRDATFDRVLFDGDEFGTLAEPGSDEELDFIGIPGILEPEQVAELLRHRQARQARRAAPNAAQARRRGADAPSRSRSTARSRSSARCSTASSACGRS